jgi:predicted SnoaL-like aldol condensation-catalyzing enzyme
MTNKQIVLNFYEEVFNHQDLSHLDDYMTEDYFQHNPNVHDGRDGFRKSIGGKFLSLKPNVEISHILQDGDYVCVFFKCTMQETNQINKVFDLYRLENGKLAEHWDCVQHDIDKITPVHGHSIF